VDLNNRNKLCHANGCSTIASFGSLADDLPLWCSKHKNIGDVILDKLRCVHACCQDPRSFGARDGGVGLHCKTHKRPGDESRRKLRIIMRGVLGLEKV
jgi:hypothetical protein